VVRRSCQDRWQALAVRTQAAAAVEVAVVQQLVQQVQAVVLIQVVA
jgi:hypothetical protein